MVWKNVEAYLNGLPKRFFGQVVIRIRNGFPTLITVERTYKIDNEERGKNPDEKAKAEELR
jgi:hypothetical protein